jgi:hypothetical protein
LIPSTKASPEWILELLRIVSVKTGDIKGMKSAIHQYLLAQSVRGKRNERNSVYAIAFPTLDRLGLKEGKGESVRLSRDGEILLRASERDIDEYRRLLAKVVYRIDSEKAHVLEALQHQGDTNIDREDLVTQLRSLGVSTTAGDDRLNKWLRFLEYCSFISRDDGSRRLNPAQIGAIEKGGLKAEFDDFLEAFFEEYRRLKVENRGNMYVRIPDLERRVQNRLSDFDFTTFDFRRYLRQLKGFHDRRGRILFSKPGARERGGIRLNGNYYYYVSIVGGE